MSRAAGAARIRFVAPLLACCAGKRLRVSSAPHPVGFESHEMGANKTVPLRGPFPIQWWAMRDSNPQPCACKAPALTVAPRALEVSGNDSNGGYPFELVSHHDERYYHARVGRSTHDLVRQEDHGAAFGPLACFQRPGPAAGRSRGKFFQNCPCIAAGVPV